MARPRVLVIDDDQRMTDFLKRALSYAGFDVGVANDGVSGLQQALATPPDAVVLDLMMPGIDGFEVLRRLRAGGDVPVLMLTVRGEVSDRVEGLKAGADDYLVKPFALEELIARLEALIRRRETDAPRKLQFSDVRMDLGTREAWRRERPLELTVKEFDVLAAFLRQPRQVLSRSQLLEQVWGFDSEVDTHVLEVYVRYLRAKLEEAGEPRLIHTVRGAGYVLKEPDM